MQNFKLDFNTLSTNWTCTISAKASDQWRENSILWLIQFIFSFTFKSERNRILFLVMVFVVPLYFYIIPIYF